MPKWGVEIRMLIKVESKLNIYFALMACICGLTFFGTPELGSLPFIAIFFALFGLVFVDLLRWFALPATMAYVALGAIAFYTVNRFLTIGAHAAEPQMVAVAELLVLVQSVLMLQRKNRRIYEQLAVFALLELIVAAIFNHAISYGVLLLPLGAVAIGALSLLHVYTTSEEAFGKREVSGSPLRISSVESRQSFMEMASPLPRLGMFTIAPSAMLVALVFFYALPRTNQESRRTSGNTQVGFNSEVRLGQIGKMMLNSEIAARIQVLNRRTGLRYDIVGDLYVRGAVLETYDQLDGTWFTAKSDPQMQATSLPASPLSQQTARRSFNDDLAVKLTVAPMRGTSLFSLPPYHFDASGPEVLHNRDRWVLSRRPRNILARESQITYRFATLGFKDGIQQAFLPRFATGEGPSVADEQAKDGADEGTAKETAPQVNAASAPEESGGPESAATGEQSTESLADSIKEIFSGETFGSPENDAKFRARDQEDRAISAAELCRGVLGVRCGSNALGG
jgi:protein-glutamine gamma-glutamyltransferase